MTQEVSRLTIVIGPKDKECDASPDSTHTTSTAAGQPPAKINLINFRKAARFAQISSNTTVLITGDSEPFSNIQDIENYLDLLAPYDFPFIELQTNALEIGWMIATHPHRRQSGLREETLKRWQTKGLDTIVILAVHTDNKPDPDGQGNYPSLHKTISYLGGLGFMVVLRVMDADSSTNTQCHTTDLPHGTVLSYVGGNTQVVDDYTTTDELVFHSNGLTTHQGVLLLNRKNE